MEAGGLLFGTRTGDVLRIAAWRPIACEHSKGFAFVLSERDLLDLSQLMQNSRTDRELKNYEIAGWFVSHTRADLNMMPDDLVVFDQCFPLRWQVTLVLRPGHLAPTRAAFSVRDEHGQVCGPDPASEFTLEPLRQARVHGQAAMQSADNAVPQTPRPRAGLVPAPRGLSDDTAPVRPARPAGSVSSRQPAETPRAYVERRPERRGGWGPERARTRKSKLRLLWFIPIAAALVFGALFVKERFFTTPALPATFALKIEDTQGGQLNIAWDKDAAAVRAADRGVVEIDDGGKSQTLTLDRSQLTQGGTTYTRRSGDVKVKLSLFQPNNSTPVAEMAQFVGPRPGESMEDRRRWEKERTELQAQIKSLRAQLARETARSAQLSKLVGILQQRLKVLQR